MKSLGLDIKDVPVLCRIVVTCDGDQVANTTAYFMPDTLDDEQPKLVTAFIEAGYNEPNVVIYPA